MKTRVNRINVEQTERLKREVLPMLTDYAQSVAGTMQMFVTDAVRGRANLRTRILRVPVWAMKREGKSADGGPLQPLAYAAYYLAHEMAHISGDAHGHGEKFMREFGKLCPREFQHFELRYKPRAARKYLGIGK